MGPLPAATPTVLTVHWSPMPGQADTPSAAARRSLIEWAEARGVRLAEPAEGALPAVTADPAIGDAVEEQLERARDAITAHDPNGADTALTRAEALLHAHPELPQAAWLLAEVERARSARWRGLPPVGGVGGATDSARAWSRAAGLDGGRSGGVGEADAGSARDGGAVAMVDGPEAVDGVEVRVDGVAGTTHRLANTAATEHQVTVTRLRDGVLLWAGWVTLDRDGHVRIALPPAVECSADDLRAARLATLEVSAPGVRCPDWIFVEEDARAPARRDRGAEVTLEIAWCSGDRCGPPLEWRVGPPGPVLPDRRAQGAWPAWATWTIVGASAAAVTVATLAATGVFRPTHDEPLFTTGGLHISATTFRLRTGE